MPYQLKEVTIRTDNTPAGMKRIENLWEDILNGMIPILYDSSHKIQTKTTLVSKYSQYDRDENGEYNLTIMAVSENFFEGIETKTAEGLYKKYSFSDENGDLNVCTSKAWEKVWTEQKSGCVKRAFEDDYERTVPKEFSADGQAHCCLYISLCN